MSNLDKYGHHLRLCSKAPCICGLEEAIQRARESVHVSDVPSAALWADLRAQLAQALSKLEETAAARDEAVKALHLCRASRKAFERQAETLRTQLDRALKERDEAREWLEHRP